MNNDFFGTLLLGFMFAPFIKHEIPKEILEFCEKYKDEGFENHLDEIAPFMEDYYKSALEGYKLLYCNK